MHVAVEKVATLFRPQWERARPNSRGGAKTKAQKLGMQACDPSSPLLDPVIVQLLSHTLA